MAGKKTEGRSHKPTGTARRRPSSARTLREAEAGLNTGIKRQARSGSADTDQEALLLKARLFDTMNQSFILTDRNGLILYVNEAFSEVCGYAKEELTGKNPRMLCSNRNDEELYSTIQDTLLRNGYWQGEIWCVRKDETTYPVWISITTIKDSRGEVANYAGITLDISKLKQNEERLEYMANYDLLTKLPNRSLMYDRLKQALSLAKRYRYPVAVMLIDLDRFKEINDTMGHHIGDQLLMEAAFRLIGCVRESDTVARMGGDEFLVILPEVGTANNAAHVAQKILDEIARPFELEGHEVFISASIGITLYPSDSEDMHMLVKNADTAMYHAKAQGKNNFKFFTEDINKSTIERFKLESRFRRAIEKLEFHLNYQPKMDIQSGKITGMEALLRWYHPDHGSVNPALFIPLAEETGLVVPLSEWALREACRQNKAWQDEGLPPLRISVNLSARHFHKKDLAEMILGVLDDTGLEPRYLMLEITESTIIENIQDTIQTLKRFREMGIGVSIDDFGTGYSSLNYLNRFSIDELKIDRSFVLDSAHDSDSRKVISAIIALAHNLNLKVIAEGVETEEQLAFLREGKCDEVQGYLFSRPLGSEDFRKLLVAQFHDRKLITPHADAGMRG